MLEGGVVSALLHVIHDEQCFCGAAEAAWLSEPCVSNLKVTQYFSVVVTSGSFLVSCYLPEVSAVETGQNLDFGPVPEQQSMHCFQAYVLG